MKLTAFFIFAFCMYTSARGLSQTVTFSGNQVSLEKVFTAIKKQTGYYVIWNYNLLEDAKPVTVSARNQPIEKFIQDVLKDQPLQYVFRDKTIVIGKKSSEEGNPSSPIIAALIDIRGKVVNENGEPLAQVSVVVQGTNRGTVTNEKGEFAIAVNSRNAILLFSYLGYVTQSITVGDRQALNITLLADNKELSDVVVTAFGIEKSKKALGYSTQVVNGGELTVARETNVANALKGRVAGLHVNPSSGGPGGSSFVMIRGNSSLTGNGQPLYVVDGVPIDNQTLDAATISSGRDYGDGIGNINPDDIENVTVLKGPAAASLYGARGSNGVILITTKKGKKGKGVGVDFNSNSTFEKPNVIPTQQNVWGGGYDDDYNSMGTTTVNGQQYLEWPSWLVDNYGGKMDGRLISIQRFRELGLVPYTPQPADNIKDFFQTGSTLTNTVGLSGGNEAATYRLSLSDLHNQGIIPKTKLERQTVNLRISANATANLSVDAKVNYIRQEGTNRPQNNSYSQNPMTALMLMPRFISLDALKNYKKEDGSMARVNGALNPYWIINELTGNDTRDRLIGFISAKYKFTHWLSLQARTGTDVYVDTRYNQIGQATSGENGRVENTQFRVKEENSDLLLTANGNLDNDFTGTLSLGVNHLNRRQKVIGNTGTNMNVPGLYYIGNMQNITPREYAINKKMNSAYFSGQLGYKNFLFVDVTGRNDWSSTLGANNLAFFYPSVATSFVFTDAIAMDKSVLGFGKLRVSYAEAGNDAEPYRTLAGYTVTSSVNYNGQPFAYIRTDIPLTTLKNELTRSYEFGTELRFFNNRLGLDLTYYHSSTINQILPVEISATTGYSTRLINAGEIRNKGIEVFLNTTAVKSRNFAWDITLNFSKNNSRVVSLNEGIPTLTIMDPGYGASIEARVGEPYGNIVGYRLKRNPAGEVLLTNEGKWQRADEREVMGTIQPDFLAGLTNIFTIRDFSLSFMLDTRKGGQILSYSKLNQMAKGTGKFTENRESLIADGVIEDAPGHYVKNTIVIPAQAYYAEAGPWGDIGETQVIDADYVALRELTLGYNLSSVFKKKDFLKGARLSVVGRNLFYLYRDPEFKTMGLSPETAFSATTAAQGYESLNMPTTRSIGINLSFSF